MTTPRMLIPKMIRQGDVLLIQVGAPQDLGTEVPMSTMGPVLALGEATGHHHTVVAEPQLYDCRDLPEDTLRDGDEYTVRSWAAECIQRAIDCTAPGETGPAARLYRNEAGMDTLECLRHTILRHEEHAAVLLDPGYYRVVRQRELVEGEIRAVQD